MPAHSTYRLPRRSHVFVISNTKTGEPGSRMLSKINTKCLFYLAIRDGSDTVPAHSPYLFPRRNAVFAIHNAITNEPGQEVLNERSEFRNLTRKQ